MDGVGFAKGIADGVSTNGALTSLDISKQVDEYGEGGIGAEGAKYIAEAIKPPSSAGAVARLLFQRNTGEHALIRATLNVERCPCLWLAARGLALTSEIARAELLDFVGGLPPQIGTTRQIVSPDGRKLAVESGGRIHCLDAASGVRNDRGRDPDGNDSAACAVRPEGPGMAKPAIGITKKWKSST